MNSVWVLLAALFCCYSKCTELPSSFKKCTRKDDNINQCLREAVEDAVKQLKKPKKEVGLVGLEPLKIPALTIGAGSGPVGLAQEYKNVKVSGHHQISCSQVDMDFEKKTLKLQCSIPEMKMEFEYSVNGKILLLPVYGTGPGSIILNDLDFVLTMNLEEYDKNGAKHWKLVGNSLSMDPKLIKFNFENLFDGDKALGDNINKVINENWQEVFADVKSSYEDAFGRIYSSIFDSLLGKVSVDELFDDK